MHEYLLIIPVAEDWDKEDDDKVEEAFDKFIGMYICMYVYYCYADELCCLNYHLNMYHITIISQQLWLFWEEH